MELQIGRNNIQKAVDEIKKQLEVCTMVKVSVTDPTIGKWTMTRLWRSWMGSTAKFMAGNGAIMPLVVNPDGTYTKTRPFDENDAHELFSRKYLGTDENGNRLSWAKTSVDGMKQADKSQRWYALSQHQIWMSERGIQYINPRDSEFVELLKHMDDLEGKGFI